MSQGRMKPWQFVFASASLFVGLWPFARVAQAQDVGFSPTMTIQGRDLQADVGVLERAYVALHPGLYRYNTPAQTDAHFKELRKRLDGPHTLAEAYLAFSEFAATVRCGHTFANPTNQRPGVQAALFERGSHRLPAEFLWRDGRILVTRDLTQDRSLPRGTVVDAIGGVPTADILAKLMRIARADGGNDAKRIDQLQVQGTERYEAFDIFLPLYFPAIGDRMKLHTIAPDGKARDIEVPGLTYAQRLSQRRGENDATAGWRFDMRDAHVAVMTMPTWAVYDAKWDWQAWIEDAFARLAREPRDALVIDLRGNEGGSDVGDAILPHLLDKSLAVVEPPRLVRYEKVPRELAVYLDTWDPSFKDWGDDAEPSADRHFGQRWYRLREEGDTGADDERIRKQIAPRAPRFPGRVFVLIDASNSSATFQFAQRLRETKLATLVGAPTGGNQRGINGGAFFFLRLPNSGVELDLPLIARFPSEGGQLPPDAGIAPDLLAVPTAQDIAQGRDVAKTAVRRALEATR